MNLTRFYSDKRTWSPADEGAGAAADDGAAAAADAGTGEAAAAEGAAQEQSAAPDYSFLPETVRSETGLNPEAFRTHYEELAAENARYKDGLDAVPADGKYDFALPDALDFGELDLPKDFTVNLKADDPAMAPLFGQLADWMKAHNIPADAAKDVTGLLARYEATKASQHYSAAKADFERLGATDSARQARIGAAKRAIEAKLPAEQAKALMAAATTFDGVRALETIFQPRGPGPTVPQNQSAADLENMPASQRLKHINAMQGAK
jgi:hypothetical protein